MIDIIELSVKSLPAFSKYIPNTLREEYVFNRNLFIMGIYSMDEPSGVVVLERKGSDATMLFYTVDEALEDEYYATGMMISLLYELKNKHYKTFSTTYQKSIFPALHSTLADFNCTFEDMENGYYRFVVKDMTSDLLRKGKTDRVISLANADQHKIDVLANSALEAYELYVDAPINKEDYEADCSCLYVDKNIPKGMLLIRQISEQELNVSMMYSDGTAMMAPIEMLQYLTAMVTEKYGEDTTVSITALDEKMVAFIKKVTGLEPELQTRATIKLDTIKSFDKDLARLLA